MIYAYETRNTDSGSSLLVITSELLYVFLFIIYFFHSIFYLALFGLAYLGKISFAIFFKR